MLSVALSTTSLTAFPFEHLIDVAIAILNSLYLARKGRFPVHELHTEESAEIVSFLGGLHRPIQFIIRRDQSSGAELLEAQLIHHILYLEHDL
jgi:hypothetical protein